MQNKLTAVISGCLLLTAVVSCVKNDRSLGEDFVSEDYILKMAAAEFKLPVVQRQRDTIQGRSASTMITGFLYDDRWGTTVAGGASLVVPILDSAYLGIQPELKDIYMDLVIDSCVCYTDDAAIMPQNIYIYELVKPIDSTMLFNNSITADYLSDEPVSLGSPMIFGSSIVEVGLSEEYGRRLLTTTPDEFEDPDLFSERIYGLYITTGTPDSRMNGGRLNYLGLKSSVIYVNYVMNDPERGIVDKDTTVQFLFGYEVALNQFTTVSNLRVPDDDPGDTLYMEGLSGVKPVIPADTLKKMLDEWSDSICASKGCERESILLSRAALHFPYEMPEDFESFENEHPEHIFPFFTDVHAADSSAMMVTCDDLYYSSGGEMDRSAGEYICDVTEIMQNMITVDASRVDDTADMWICPVGETLVSSYYSSSSYYSFDCETYFRLMLDGPKSARPPYMTILYSLLEY